MRFSSSGQTWGRRNVHKLAKMTSRRRFGSFVYTIAQRAAAECAFPHLGKRRLTSRKSAFCPDGLTQKRILDSIPHAKAHSGGSEDPRVHLSVRTSCRMRFSVTRWLQNALFRRVRFSSPGQTRRRLTERRTLRHRLTERRILQPASWTKHSLHDLKLSKLRFT